MTNFDDEYHLVIKKIDDEIKEALETSGQRKIRVSYSNFNHKKGVPVSNLHKIAKKGTIVLIGHIRSPKGKTYISERITNPTWLEICVLANEMIKITGITDHIFFEGIRKMPKNMQSIHEDSVPLYEFVMGS